MTFPIDFPRQCASNEKLTLSRRQSITEANASYQTTVVHTASQWQLSWNWPRMTHDLAEGVNAWILKLNGEVGTFRYYPTQSRVSTLSDMSLAVAGYAYNTAVSVGGWAANAASGLRPGQYFQIGNQLLLVTDAAANADANGQVIINFAPELRTAFPVATSVNFANPCGVFRMNTSEGLGFGLDPDRRPDFSSIAAREDTNA